MSSGFRSQVRLGTRYLFRDHRKKSKNRRACFQVFCEIQVIFNKETSKKQVEGDKKEVEEGVFRLAIHMPYRISLIFHFLQKA